MVDPAYEGGSGKLEDVSHRLETAVGEKHKILVFSQFVKHLALVKECVEDKKLPYAYLDGSTRNRRSQVELFQREQEVQIFLISLKAGGLGLNLTAADYVFILDPWWNPAIEAQAVDRAHRIGSSKPCSTTSSSPATRWKRKFWPCSATRNGWPTSSSPPKKAS